MVTVNFLARPDLRDARGEEVRPFLVDQRRLLPFRLRLLVRSLRLAALAHHALDDAARGLDAHPVDRGVLRQREAVDALAPLRGRIGEALDDEHPRHQAADVHVHVGCDPRRVDRARRRRRRTDSCPPGLAATAGSGAASRVRGRDEHGQRQHQAREQPHADALQRELQELPPPSVRADPHRRLPLAAHAASPAGGGRRRDPGRRPCCAPAAGRGAWSPGGGGRRRSAALGTHCAPRTRQARGRERGRAATDRGKPPTTRPARRRPGAGSALRYSRRRHDVVCSTLRMSRRIALVEDEPALAANLAEALTRHGYEVATYATRAGALAAFRTRLPDLALVDIGLADDVDGGFELAPRAARDVGDAADPVPVRARQRLRHRRRPAAGRRRLPDQGREPAAPRRRASPRCSGAATCWRRPPPPRTCSCAATWRSTSSG